MEKLLSQKEIDDILEEAKNPRYSAPNTLFFTFRKTHIFRVSRESGLILIHGDEHTGLEHIMFRHDKSSNKAYWNKDGKLENQSKFRLGLAPLEYIAVASKLYKSENKNDDKNRRPENFDLYIGEYSHKDNVKAEYTLITYRDTGIIHTFFVSDNKKPFNKKKILDLRRGWAYGSETPLKQKLKIPYYDANNFELFTILIEYSKGSNAEEWFIRLNGEKSLKEKIIKVGEKERKAHPILGNDAGARIIQLNYLEGQSWIEKHIKRILIDHLKNN